MDETWAAGPTRELLTVRLRDAGSIRSALRSMLSASAKAVSIAWTTLILIAFVAPAIPVLFGYKLMIVTSGSMVPELGIGDVAIIDDRAPESLGEGDVITFRPIGGHTLTTHRIVARKWVEGRLYFQTKGDANETPDPNLAPALATLGRLVASVPGYGFLLAYASTPAGRLALLAPPAALILIQETRRLGAHRLPRCVRRVGPSAEEERTGAGRTLPARSVLPSMVLAVLVTVATWAIVSTAPTSAQFANESTVAGNMFATSPQFP
jgi:signal peptidase I